MGKYSRTLRPYGRKTTNASRAFSNEAINATRFTIKWYKKGEGSGNQTKKNLSVKSQYLKRTLEKKTLLLALLQLVAILGRRKGPPTTKSVTT